MQINQSINWYTTPTTKISAKSSVWACGNHRNISHITWNLPSRTVGNHKTVCQSDV